MATIDEINQQYAIQEQSANYFLSRGMTSAANQAHQRMQDLVAQRDDIVTSQGTGGGGGEVQQYDAALEYQKQLAAAAESRRVQNASAVMKSLLTEYNLSSLYAKVLDYIRDGYDPDAIMVLLRTTPEYNQRFPAMKALAEKGRAISEAEYIDYEKTAAGLERRYGLPDGMLMGNVTGLLTNEVSASELNDRVILASAAAIEAPADVRNTFMDYYGIDQGGLTAYFLDPDKATPLLEKQYASSLIGTEAARQGIGIDAYGAENLQSLGISQEQARQGFGRVAGSMSLTQGRGDVVTQGQLISGTFAQDEQALRDIERASKARTGQFQQGGGFTTSQQGVSGLGSAATR